MDDSRRSFLKIAGLSVLGVGAGSVVDAGAVVDVGAVTGEGTFEVDQQQLMAKRWAMVIDHKKCLKAKPGCQVCIDACNDAHNIPDFSSLPDQIKKDQAKKDAVKWIWQEPYENTFPGQENPYIEEYVHDTLKGMKMVVLCNHCDNPPCVRVCPVKATFKRPDGIVMMDYHRCIGCRFCMAACPYGARSLNWRDPRGFIKKENPDYPTRTRGVVEKCTFCFERLAKGKMPACVEACKDKALVFGDISDPKSEVREVLRKNPSIQRKPQLGTQPQVYYIL